MRYSEFPVEKLPESWDLLPLKSLAQKGVKAFTDGDWIETPFIIVDMIPVQAYQNAVI
jgi:hypothetical protein